MVSPCYAGLRVLNPCIGNPKQMADMPSMRWTQVWVISGCSRACLFWPEPIASTLYLPWLVQSFVNSSAADNTLYEVVMYLDSVANTVLLCRQVTVTSVLFEDWAASLISAVQQLPALKSFDIAHDGGIDDVEEPLSDKNGLPHCQQLAALRSHSLTKLRVCMLGSPQLGNTLRLIGLPELRSCELVGEMFQPLNMRIDAASFQGTPMLEELRLWGDEGLELQPGSLAQLTGLTALAIKGCGLRTVPEDVASVSATLRQLDLSSNDRLQISHVGMASILCCSHLAKLDLTKQDVHHWRSHPQDVWQRVE